MNGAPIMDHLLRRMAGSVSAERIIVVTRPEKTDISDHARARGHRVAVGRPADVAQSLTLGLAAADAAWGPDPERIALLGFPDTLFAPPDAFGRLTALLTRADLDVVLGLFHFDEPARADVVDLLGHRVRSVRPKPARPVSDLVWGIGAARCRALTGLADVAEPGELFDRLAAGGLVGGVDLGSDYLDIGVPEVLQRVRRAAPDW